MILKYSLYCSNFDVHILLINSFSNNIANETRNINKYSHKRQERPKGNVYKYLSSLLISL